MCGERVWLHMHVQPGKGKQKRESRGRCCRDGHIQYHVLEQKSIRLAHDLRWYLQASSMGFLLINLKHTLRYSLHSNPAVLEHSLTAACSSNTATCSGKQRVIMSLLLFGQANKCQICTVQADSLLNGAFPWQVEDLSPRELKPYSSTLGEHLKHSTHFIFKSLKVSRPGSDRGRNF